MTQAEATQSKLQPQAILSEFFTHSDMLRIPGALNEFVDSDFEPLTEEDRICMEGMRDILRHGSHGYDRRLAGLEYEVKRGSGVNITITNPERNRTVSFTAVPLDKYEAAVSFSNGTDDSKSYLIPRDSTKKQRERLANAAFS